MRQPAILLCLALAGCAARPFEYRSQNEIPEGPGFLTGEAGAFVLRTDEAGPLPPRESEEYREFREWREFQEWKRRNPH